MMLLALLPLALATAVAATAVPPEIHDGPSAPALAWKAAVEAGDLAALRRMHGADTTVFPPDQVEARGAAAIAAGYAALFARNGVTVTFDDAHWIAVPPLVVSWGRTTLTLHPKGGGPDVVTHTRFTDAALAVAGGWRYVVDHASKEPQP